MSKKFEDLKLNDDIFKENGFELIEIEDYAGFSYQVKTFQNGISLVYQYSVGFSLVSGVDEFQFDIFKESNFVSLLEILSYQKPSFLQRLKDKVIDKIDRIKRMFGFRNDNLPF